MNESVATLGESTLERRNAAGGVEPAAVHPEMPSLTEPLPADVFREHAAFLGYRGYPVFSAPWFWGRTKIFGPLAAAIGLAETLLLGLEIHDGRLGVLYAAVAVPIWIAFVTAGPAFATIVRHRRLPQQTERVAVVIAIAAGVLVSIAGQYAAEVFVQAMVAPRVLAYFGYPAQALHKPSPLFFTVLRTVQAVIFLCLGGGLALRTFFREQRVWIEVQHARELAALRRDKNEADLRLTVLQAQVEPHFLFNTLASIHSLIRKDPHRAEATLEALVDHLRATLPRFRADVGSTHSTLDQQ
ncbi:MAG TPA: histidine kinase, partial [Steroidobacteraceae bacterium]|nr:histidine kinase [Steroidobacteraceae bacterium]